MRLSRASTLRIVLAGALSLGALWFWHRSVGAAPAAPDLSRADPEVRVLITTAIDRSRKAPLDAGKRAELGMVYEANGFDDQARRCYEQAVAADPLRPRWWYRLAVVAGRRGEHEAALDAVGRTIALEPAYAPAHWRQGLWLLDMGDPSRAEAAFRRALAVDARDPGGTAGLARVLLTTHKFQEATSLLEPAVAQRPSDLYLRQLLGAAYRGLGQIDAARAALTAGVRSGPVPRDLWTDELSRFRTGYPFELLNAEALYRTGQLDASIAALHALLAKRPDDPIALKYLGAAYVERGRTDDAITTLKRTLAVQESQSEAHINLAVAYFQKHATEEGLKEAERALALNPTSGAAYQIKGLILRDVHRLEPAMDAFALSTRYNPANVMPRVWTGLILRQLNRRREALDAFEDVLNKDPTSADAFAGIAMIRLDEGALAAASDAIRRGADFDRGNAAIAEARARLWKLEDARGAGSPRRR